MNSTYRELDINLIELDNENPRIKMFLENYKEVTAEALAFALSGGASDGSTSFGYLQESIRVNGGIINPIIVNHTIDDRYVVIEGNTRVQIYKEFQKNKTEGDWSKIRSIVYENLSEAEIHSIRLQAHMVGPRDWDPYSKAKYLDKLMNKELLPMSQIISFCGGKASEIKKLVSAYNDMQTYYIPMIQQEGMDFDYRDFSKYSELQNKGIIDSLAMHGYTKNDFTKWVIDGNVDTAQKVRELPAVLKNPEAKNEFLRTNLTNAVRKLGVSSANMDLNAADYYELARTLTNKLDRIEFKEQQFLMSEQGREKRNALSTLKDSIVFVIGDNNEEN